MIEKAKETWDEYRRRTVKWAIRMEFAMLHSTAYRSLQYGPTLKVLNWFHEKRSIDVDKKKRGSKRYTVKVQDVSFTYTEAALRGLDHKKFARALRELHVHGFIDVIYLGSGKKRDYTRYALSDRWRTFGAKDFEVIDFPKNISYVARDEVTKRWTGRSSKQVQRPISAVDQRPICAVEDPVQRPISAVIDPVIDESSTANMCRILSTKPWGVDLKGGSTKRGSAPETGSISIATAQLRAAADTTSPKQWQPPLSEIRENVAEILRQRPDHRVDDPQFVRLISRQLGEALAGRLDPGRVHSDFQGKHGFDDWTTDLLFTIATINLISKGATN